MQTTLIDSLGGVALFAGLTRRQLATVADICRHHRYGAGAEIVAEGDVSGRFDLILRGTADVNVRGRCGSTLHGGSYFGEIGVIDRGERSAQVVATSAVEAASLASFNFRALLREHPGITTRLLVAVCARLRRAEATD